MDIHDTNYFPLVIIRGRINEPDIETRNDEQGCTATKPALESLNFSYDSMDDHIYLRDCSKRSSSKVASSEEGSTYKPVRTALLAMRTPLAAFFEQSLSVSHLAC
jgi:hypothetical protein